MPATGSSNDRLLDALAELYAPAPAPDLAARVIQLAGCAVAADSCSYTGFDAAGAAARWAISPPTSAPSPTAHGCSVSTSASIRC